MRKEECVIFCKLVYITKDTDNNIVIGISKRTKTNEMIKILKLYEDKEVNISIIPADNDSSNIIEQP